MTKEPKTDRQREHQANERTFLAWVRTSIALIGFGFAIARFGIFLRQLHLTLTDTDLLPHPFLNSETLGGSLVIAGILAILLSAWRYNQVFIQIEQGNYQPTRLAVWITTGVVAILGVLSLPLLVVRDQLPSSSSPSSNGQPHRSNLRRFF
jgi:putative membrane protein